MEDLALRPLVLVGVAAAIIGGLFGAGLTVLLSETGVLELAGKEGPPGERGPQGAPGPEGPPGEAGDVSDLESTVEDLDSRVSDLEDGDADSRLSDLEDFQSGLCSQMQLSDLSAVSDLGFYAC